MVAIIDTGIDLSHPDLASNLGAGLDLVDEDDCDVPQDRVGHGTFVAGIVAAEKGNGIGIAGVAPDAKLMPIRVARGDEFLTIELLEVVNRRIAHGIYWAVDHGADIINLSVSTSLFGPFDDVVAGGYIPEAVAYATRHDVLVVAAAGNTPGHPVCEYPAADPRTTICVASTTEYATPSPNSSLPNKPDGGIGLRAPGGAATLQCEHPADIWSTALPGSQIDCGSSERGYDTSAGTSAAAPFVAGALAILLGEDVSPNEAVKCLTSTALNPATGMRGTYDPVYGYGIVDVDAALTKCRVRDSRRPGGAIAHAPPLLSTSTSPFRSPVGKRLPPEMALDRLRGAGG